MISQVSHLRLDKFFEEFDREQLSITLEEGESEAIFRLANEKFASSQCGSGELTDRNLTFSWGRKKPIAIAARQWRRYVYALLIANGTTYGQESNEQKNIFFRRNLTEHCNSML